MSFSWAVLGGIPSARRKLARKKTADGKGADKEPADPGTDERDEASIHIRKGGESTPSSHCTHHSLASGSRRRAPTEKEPHTELQDDHTTEFGSSAGK